MKKNKRLPDGHHLEKVLQKEIKQFLDQYGHFNVITVMSPASKNGRGGAGARMKSPMKGMADIIGCLNSGLFMAVEVKRPDRKAIPSDSQKIYLQNIMLNGGVALCVNSLEEVEETVEALVEAKLVERLPGIKPVVKEHVETADKGFAPAL